MDFSKISLDLSVHGKNDIIKGVLENAAEKLPVEPTIEIERYDENNILLAVRPYATYKRYWDVHFKSYREIKSAFAREGIVVVYPTRIVKNR